MISATTDFDLAKNASRNNVAGRNQKSIAAASIGSVPQLRSERCQTACASAGSPRLDLTDRHPRHRISGTKPKEPVVELEAASEIRSETACRNCRRGQRARRIVQVWRFAAVGTVFDPDGTSDSRN